MTVAELIAILSKLPADANVTTVDYLPIDVSFTSIIDENGYRCDVFITDAESE